MGVVQHPLRVWPGVAGGVVVAASKGPSHYLLLVVQQHRDGRAVVRCRGWLAGLGWLGGAGACRRGCVSPPACHCCDQRRQRRLGQVFRAHERQRAASATAGTDRQASRRSVICDAPPLAAARERPSRQNTGSWEQSPRGAAQRRGRARSERTANAPFAQTCSSSTGPVHGAIAFACSSVRPPILHVARGAAAPGAAACAAACSSRGPGAGDAPSHRRGPAPRSGSSTGPLRPAPPRSVPRPLPRRAQAQAQVQPGPAAAVRGR
jgi:hypothetical protein